jgi:glycosyltransferase involved in cell wall biosynthesis
VNEDEAQAQQPVSPGEAPELSVLVPARNAEATIAEQLEALVTQEWDHPWEIVVVDNGSSDATRAIVARYEAGDPRVRLVDASDHVGISYARNVGMAAARGCSIAVCDADDVVAPGWLAAMGNALSQHRVVTGAFEVHRLNAPWVVESRGGEGAARSRFDFGGLFPFPNGGNFGVRREVLDCVGGFDQRFSYGGEDIEFGFRLWRAGIEVHVAEDAVLHLRYRSTIGSMWRQARDSSRVYALLRNEVRSAGFEVVPDDEWKRWVWLVRNLGRLRTRGGRARWVVTAGGRVGRVQGAAAQWLVTSGARRNALKGRT